jgi:hypothetical protein
MPYGNRCVRSSTDSIAQPESAQLAIWLLPFSVQNARVESTASPNGPLSAEITRATFWPDVDACITAPFCPSLFVQ